MITSKDATFERKCRREPVPSRENLQIHRNDRDGREDGNETFPVSSSHARDSLFLYFFTILKQPRGITITEFRVEFLDFVSFQPIAMMHFVYRSVTRREKKIRI